MEDKDTGEVIIIIRFVDPAVDESTVKEFMETIKESEHIREAIKEITVRDEVNNVEIDHNTENGNATTVIVVEEILLEPERVFEVTSVMDSDEFMMMDTPPILAKVFGKQVIIKLQN